MAQYNPKIGYIITGLVAAFLAFDGVIHVLRIQPVVDSAVELGFPVRTMLWIGLIELAALCLFLYPKTSVLGAMGLTAYLGGAVASQLRIEAYGPVGFAVGLGLAMWAGLYLRNPDLRRLVPLQTKSSAAGPAKGR